MASSGQYFQPLSKKVYEGSSVEIVIGIDVGTTFSGVSYVILRPKECPVVQAVERFSSQANGNSKVPSIMYYSGSEMKSAGAEAVTENIAHKADFEGWQKVEYFKMHLRPAHMTLNTNGLTLKELPNQLNIVQVLSDFLRYLYKETLEYIVIHHTDGEILKKIAEERATFVMSHPNGWTGLPQQRMREAAVKSGLVKSSGESHSRIKFVSEGEASALSCLSNGLCPPDLKPGFRFVIADAGGGTLDITSYEITRSEPKIELKEITSSDCRFAGSIFVNIKFREFLKKKLEGTKFSNPEEIDDFVNGPFEMYTKRGFKDTKEPYWLRVGGRKDNDSKLGIRMGSLRIEGSDLASCFEFSVTEAIKSIKQQIVACGGDPMPVWLVGGFGSSPWLLKQLQERLLVDKIQVNKPDTNLAKAVANGNILYDLEKSVVSRYTRSTYGAICSVAYDANNREHLRRTQLTYVGVDGVRRLPGLFDVIVPKNTEVKEVEKFSSLYSYVRPLHRGRDFITTEIIYFYCDELHQTIWHDEKGSSLYHACKIIANLSDLCCDSTLESRNDAQYWKIMFEIEISFGTTELQARIKWNDKGQVKYGPASIFYDEGDVLPSKA